MQRLSTQAQPGEQQQEMTAEQMQQHMAQLAALQQQQQLAAAATVGQQPQVCLDCTNSSIKLTIALCCTRISQKSQHMAQFTRHCSSSRSSSSRLLRQSLGGSRGMHVNNHTYFTMIKAAACGAAAAAGRGGRRGAAAAGIWNVVAVVFGGFSGGLSISPMLSNSPVTLSPPQPQAQQLTQQQQQQQQPDMAAQPAAVGVADPNAVAAAADLNAAAGGAYGMVRSDVQAPYCHTTTAHK